VVVVEHAKRLLVSDRSDEEVDGLDAM